MGGPPSDEKVSTAGWQSVAVWLDSSGPRLLAAVGKNDNDN